MGGWLEILKLMLPQPNLGWELAELGKKQTGFGKKVNEKYSVTFCESIRNDSIQSSFAIDLGGHNDKINIKRARDELEERYY